MTVNKSFWETTEALHRYGAGINAETETTRQFSSMETNRSGSYTLRIWSSLNSFGAEQASITIESGRRQMTSIRVLCDPLGVQGSSLGTRSREREKQNLKEFTDFLEGRIPATNYPVDLRLSTQ